MGPSPHGDGYKLQSMLRGLALKGTYKKWETTTKSLIECED